jgi:very-short-patch-repair endonuclease
VIKDHRDHPVTIPYNPGLKKASQDLRNKMTAAEKRLWEKLQRKRLGYWFYRQKPIGDYIVDFYCPHAMLVIEVDGGYHKGAEVSGNDKIRDKVMENYGLKVIRFKNADILSDIDDVVAKIKKLIG